jgi:hypothetical protein
VNLAGSNNDNGRIVPLQGQKCVKFYRRFRATELRPREQRDAFGKPRDILIEVCAELPSHYCRFET